MERPGWPGRGRGSRWLRRSSASWREETGLAGRCGRFVGWVERISDDYHFVILDFLVDVGDDAEPRAGDDATEVAWVPLADARRSEPLVPGLLEFLREHAIVAVGRGAG